MDNRPEEIDHSIDFDEGQDIECGFTLGRVEHIHHAENFEDDGSQLSD